MAVDAVTIEGLDQRLRRLKAFPKEMSARGGPVRAGVRKGAMVIVNQAKANVRAIVAAPNESGIDESTGLLEKSISTFRSKARPGEQGETYVVSVKRTAKYSGKGKRNTATINAARLEYGTSRRKPMPFMRPAFHAKKNEAVKVMIEETEKGIAKIEKKLAATAP